LPRGFPGKRVSRGPSGAVGAVFSDSWPLESRQSESRVPSHLPLYSFSDPLGTARRSQNASGPTCPSNKRQRSVRSSRYLCRVEGAVRKADPRKIAGVNSATGQKATSAGAADPGVECGKRWQASGGAPRGEAVKMAHLTVFQQFLKMPRFDRPDPYGKELKINS